MMNNDLMFSSKTDNWATPQDFFDKLNNEFKFQLDVCADENNHKCARFFTKEQDGLLQEWGGGKGMVQSTLRQGCRRMGQEMFKMRLSRNATSRKDGHEMVSRIHLWESGNPICAWSPKIRESRKLGTVPFNGSGFQKGDKVMKCWWCRRVRECREYRLKYARGFVPLCECCANGFKDKITESN